MILKNWERVCDNCSYIYTLICVLLWKYQSYNISTRNSNDPCKFKIILFKIKYGLSFKCPHIAVIAVFILWRYLTIIYLNKYLFINLTWDILWAFTKHDNSVYLKILSFSCSCQSWDKTASSTLHCLSSHNEICYFWLIQRIYENFENP